jgi:hypothetical protein
MAREACDPRDDKGAIVADAILRKPFDHEELVATIHRLGASDGDKATGTPRPTKGRAHHRGR